MKLFAKLFLEKDDYFILGPGRVELLKTVQQLGSLHKAAQKLGMSYRWAWGRMNTTEEKMGVTLLAREGSAQGGRPKSLTPEAHELLAWYDSVETALETVLTEAIQTQPEFLRTPPRQKKQSGE